MALSMLVGGADCGPSNPLQGLSKRFDQDRGIQQVPSTLRHLLNRSSSLTLDRIILVQAEPDPQERYDRMEYLLNFTN